MLQTFQKLWLKVEMKLRSENTYNIFKCGISSYNEQPQDPNCVHFSYKNKPELFVKMTNSRLMAKNVQIELETS